MRQEMPAIKSAHGVGDEIDFFALDCLFQRSVQSLGSFVD